MKILLIHNNYDKYSGEEAVVDKMTKMFINQGHQVVQYRRSSSEIGNSKLQLVHAFIAGIYSPSGVKGLREVLKREKPDFVNVHNLFPFISPAALFECQKVGVPVIMTVHNFRLICPTGLFLRNNAPCERCLHKRNEWSCIRYNCEQNLLKSVGYTFRNLYARWSGAYKKNVTQYVCITEFQRHKLIEAGYDKKKITVIPNSVDIINDYQKLQGRYVAFCGRISNEKGIDLIIEVARRHPEIPFQIAGEIRDNTIIKDIPENVKLVGYLNGSQLCDFYKHAAFFVMASRCYEGFPVSILEAAQYSKCTIGPNHGGFSEIIGHGIEAIGRLFKPFDVDDLEKQTVSLWHSPNEIEKLGNRAQIKLQLNYSTFAVGQKWEELIRNILNKNKL